MPFKFAARAIGLIPGRPTNMVRNMYIEEFSKLASGDFSGIGLVTMSVEKSIDGDDSGDEVSDTPSYNLLRKAPIEGNSGAGASASGAGASGAGASGAGISGSAFEGQVRVGPPPMTAGKGAAGRGDASGAAGGAGHFVKRVGSSQKVFSTMNAYRQIFVGPREGNIAVYKDLSLCEYIRCTELIEVGCDLLGDEASKVDFSYYVSIFYPFNT